MARGWFAVYHVFDRLRLVVRPFLSSCEVQGMGCAQGSLGHDYPRSSSCAYT
jgi:hypothetical protein